MGAEASTEWRAAYDELPPSRQVQAVGLASRWGWHDQAIATAARQKLFNDYDLLYPRPFDAEVRSASRRTGLPKELIYAIIRQESLFRADAASSAGAIGLMQLLPETARLTARRAGLPEPTRSQLTKPTVNIPLGSEFLASLVQPPPVTTPGPMPRGAGDPLRRWTSTSGSRTSRSTKLAPTCNAWHGMRWCSRGSRTASRAK